MLICFSIRSKNIKNTVIVIPVYKPNELFKKFLEELISLKFSKIVVVNDGSGQNYQAIFDDVQKLNIHVAEHSKNMGKGAAIKTGIKYAILLYGKDISIITADADGQHLPADIAKIDEKLKNSNDKLILGVRNFGIKVPFNSKLGNRISSFLFYVITKIHCSDTQTGLRGIPYNLLDTALSVKGERFEYEINFLIEIAKKNTIDFVDISTVYKDNNKNSHYKILSDSLLISRIFMQNLSAGIYLKIYIVILAIFSLFILLDTFVIPKVLFKVSESEYIPNKENAVITENSYKTKQVIINIQTKNVDKTKLYIADVQLTNPKKLRTGLAFKSYGRNINQKCSEIANEYNAILAINGDNYGFRSKGLVMRNKIFFRKETDGYKLDSLIINKKGDFITAHPSMINPEYLSEIGAEHILSFGPALVKNGFLIHNNHNYLGIFSSKQPRTGICQIAPLHYLFVVTDGRLNDDSGITLETMANEMYSLGCKTAYNLDGGGSTTMVFNGKVINNPSTYGYSIKERAVSDIVYIEK